MYISNYFHKHVKLTFKSDFCFIIIYIIIIIIIKMHQKSYHSYIWTCTKLNCKHIHMSYNVYMQAQIKSNSSEYKIICSHSKGSNSISISCPLVYKQTELSVLVGDFLKGCVKICCYIPYTVYLGYVSVKSCMQRHGILF